LKLKIPQRYKCRIRDKWYVVPNISQQNLKRSFLSVVIIIPRLLKNDANVFVTDSAYKVYIKEPYDLNSFIYSFYNSFTLASAEIEGRYYGGGVLELTPNEFKNLPIPYTSIDAIMFENFASEFERKRNIESLLVKNDEKLLGDSLGLSSNEIRKVQLIRTKLVAKRF
jgi:adenine-specific DNA-methyltransferase